MTWDLQLDDGVGKRLISYPEHTPLPGDIVRLRVSGKKLIVRAKPRRGASGKVVRVAPRGGIAAGPVSDSDLSESGKIRFQFFWLFHSARGYLAMVSVILLAVGTALTGEVAIRTTVTGTINPHLAGQAWIGLGLSVVGIIVGALKDLFTD
jgi:hypothetical protein